MAYPVLAILGEVAKKAAESEVVRSAVSVIDKIRQVKADVSKPIFAKVEVAARCAGKFFGISDADLVVDQAIVAYLKCDVFVKKTVFGFVFDRFKDLTGVSIEDLTKILAHDYGSRNLEDDNSLSAWAKELGADFFTGVRSEMLGLPKSDFEKILESVKGSEICPEGSLRVNAIQYGRDVVRRFQSNGIEPTIENCKEEFVNSPYSKTTYENHHIESNSSVWVDKTDSSHLETNFGEMGIVAYPQFEKLSEQFKAFLSDKALEARVEAAAHSACKFFGIPDADLIKGDAIGVYRGCDVFLDNDVFEYNLDQFKDMKCVSFEDMTKIWAHECGHRILGDEFKDSWTKELGADFFSGVRSEMLGLPTSNFEKMLGSTKGSETHPNGNLRVNAIQFGREVVRIYQSKGIEPTIEVLKKDFANSKYSKITYENYTDSKYAAWVDNTLPAQVIKTIRDDLVGQKNPKTGVLYVIREVENDKGERVIGVFPQFESVFEVRLPEDKTSASDPEQFAEGNRQLKERCDIDPEFRSHFNEFQLNDINSGKTPIGFTWHHDAEKGKIQLVTYITHFDTRHTGGKAIWGGGKENR